MSEGNDEALVADESAATKETPSTPPPTPPVLSVFNFDAAMKVCTGNKYAVDFLTANRARLEQLGTEAGWAILLEIMSLFAAQKNAEAWEKFYGKDSSWETLAQGAAQDVTNTAAMANRWAAAAQLLRDTGAYAVSALLMIVLSGFRG